MVVFSSSVTFVVGASNAHIRKLSSPNVKAKTHVDYKCDGVADDVQLQAAIDALPAAGGKIILTEGDFNLAAILNINKPDVLIEGQGRATKITQLPSTDLVSLVETTQPFTGIKDVVLDGNRANNATGTTLISVAAGGTDFYTDNVWVENSEGDGILVAAGVVRPRIHNVFGKDVDGKIVSIPNTALTDIDGHITGIYLEGHAGRGVSLDFCSNFLVSNVVGITPTTTLNSPIYINSCQDGSISNCSIRGSKENGIYITNDGDGACKGIVVKGNVVSDCDLDGILIVDEGTLNTTDIVVIGNVVRSNGKADAAVYAGIHLKGGVTNCVVTGNRCFDDSAGSDLVTNGAFATDTGWTKGTGWTIAAGVASAAAATTSDLEQILTGLIEGQTYSVVFTITAFVAGTLTAELGGTEGTARGSAATFTENIRAGVGGSIKLKAAAFEGSVDDVTVTAVQVQDFGIMETGGSTDNLIIGNDVTGNLTGGIPATVGANTIIQNNNGSTVDGLIPDVLDAGAIPVTHSGYVPLVTLGIETRTMADPSRAGLTIDLYFKTDAGNCVVTTASPVNQTGNNTLTFSDIGEHIRLASIEDGADFEWRVVANDGVVLSTV